MGTHRLTREPQAVLEVRSNSAADDWSPVEVGAVGITISRARQIAAEQNRWLGWTKWRARKAD